MRPLPRRRLLTSGLGLGAALTVPGLVGCAGRTVSATPTHQHDSPAAGEHDGALVSEGPWESLPLAEPEVRRSEGGVLDTTLRVRYVRKEVGGYRLYLRSYEETIPGPTLRVQPGDVLRIRLINDLPPNRDQRPANANLPHHFNTTNFHFHGSHVSPGGIADNVFREMEPGESYDIEIAIPADHTRGTYWYHPHAHGSADMQVASGMAGAVIVEGDFDDVPEVAQAQERVLVLSQVVYDAYGTVETFETLFPENATRFFTVNGQREPIIQMRPGEVQRWRLLHAGYQDDIYLGLEGHGLHVIARDGIALGTLDAAGAHTVVPASGTPDAILFAPGQRVDVLVQAGAPGTYQLRALPYHQGYPAPTGPLARVVVAGEPLPMRLPTALPLAPLPPIGDGELTGSRELIFSRIAPAVEATEHWREFHFMVDEHSFDAARVDHRVRLGAVEEWTVTNVDPGNDHVFHIHINPFQVTRYNGQPVAEPIWLDTVVVPANGGSVTFRSRFTDFTGKYVLHCHMMNHEDMGMMQVVEVYDDA
ncbi:MAG TPA: multicopper oxidase family protein [Chloroflexota bacterium]|jgi:FtsP/CotA-like multicopper oxidase with cupredoxin domain